MLDSLEALAGSPWAYALILAVAAVDAFLPVVPSEATVVTAGVFAAVGDLSLALVIAAGGGRRPHRRHGLVRRRPAAQRAHRAVARADARRGSGGPTGRGGCSTGAAPSSCSAPASFPAAAPP